ncbi:MAG: spore cortex biosynthesis protein YabQ [Ruminococcus sp.]|nr:spore cortex biosynthesis protein YabQ [Ruminococcus sp.]
MTGMQLGVDAEIEVLKNSLLIGVFLGVLYDLFKIVRRTLDLKAATFLCDLLYALMFGSVYFVFTLAQTDYVRGFVLAAMLLSAAAWSFTAGRLYVFLTVKLLNFAAKVITMPIFALFHKTKAVLNRKVCGK